MIHNETVNEEERSAAQQSYQKAEQTDYSSAANAATVKLQSSYDQLQAQMQAQQLGITENTLKYHNKNIYSKLGLKSRKEAVQFIRLEKKYHNPET